MDRTRRLVRMTDSWLKGRDTVPGPRPVDWKDERQAGLVLRVEASGKRSWAVRYVFAGEQRRFRLGPYPDVSLSEARKRAQRILGQVRDGRDPQGERSALRLGETVAEVAQAWLQSEETRSWRPRSRAGFEAHLRLRIVPALGRLKLADVQPGHVQGMLDRVSRPITRNRTFETVRAMFSWAVKRRLLKSSPCVGVERLQEPPRTRTLADAEIRQVVKAFDETRLGRYVRLLFLTACRRDEALSMRWADVDTDRSLWTIPAEAEKSGGTRTEARRVALSAAALEILAAQRKQSMARGLGRSPHVFPSPTGGRLNRGAPKPVVYRLKGLRDNGTRPKVHKLAKPRPVLIPDDFRLHDVRRTVADRLLNDLGVSAYVVDVGVLGHAKPRLLGTYAPGVPLKDLRAAMEAWAAELARILGEAAPAQEEGRA